MTRMNKLKNNLLFLCFTLALFTAKGQEISVQNDSIPKVVQDTLPKIIDQLTPEKFKTTASYVLGGVSIKGNQQFSDKSITVFFELV